MHKSSFRHSLQGYFLNVLIVGSLVLGAAMFLVYYSALRSVSWELGVEYATQLVLKERAEISNGLDREITLARKLADSHLLRAWTENEESQTLKAEALAELESYKRYFKDHVYFFVIHRSGHYYFNDAEGRYTGKELQYTLDPQAPADSWYFSTIDKVKEYTLNVNYDKAIKDTKVWINVVMRDGERVLGMAGTGLSFGSFMERFVKGKQEGVVPILVNKEGAIQAHPDASLVDLSSISKREEEKSTVFRLFPSSKDQTALRGALEELAKGTEQVKVLDLRDATGKKVCAIAHIPEIQWYSLILFDVHKILGFARFLPLVLVAGSSLLLLAFFILLSLRRIVLQPLGVLTQFAKDYQQGKPAELHPHNRKDEIGVLTETLRSMVHTIREYTEKLEEKVKERTEALRDLFDRMEEGVLSFGPDLIVEPEYSKECERLFERPLTGVPILRLIDPAGGNFSALFQQTLTSAFRTKDSYKREVLLSLLPSEISFQGKILQMRVRPVGDRRMMMILKDVTYHKKLEEQITHEQKILKFVVTALGNRSYFLDTLDAFEGFLKEGMKLSSDELYRYVHTYKGVLLQLDLVYTPQALHEAEESLSIRPWNTVWDPGSILEALDQDKKILTQYLGNRFFERMKTYILEPEDLEGLERLAEKVKSSPQVVKDLDLEEELSIIPKLRRVRIFDLFAVFPSQVMELATLRGKQIEPLHIEGENLRVNPEKYEPLALSFVHIFRNAVIHGIEDPERRIEKGKPAKGKIEFTIERTSKGLLFRVRDDGQGVQWEEVRQKAVERGLIPKEKADMVSEKELCSFLLNGEVSTRDEADLFSGRGIGLSAVHKEVIRLGGSMQVHTKQDRGTELIIDIPDSEVFI
jgi:two-component system chemotaxis sensor kinase CheA